MLIDLKSINIELTNICNLTCKMCYRNNMTYPQGTMSWDLFKLIIKKIKDSNYNIKTIYLHWRGEPSLVSYLPEAIKEIKDNLNTEVVLFSNGTLLNKELLVKILNQGIDVINFSLDSNSNDGYLQIRGKDFYSSVYNNILECVKLRNNLNRKTRICIYSVLLEDNLKELIDINNEWSTIVDNVIIKYDMHEKSNIKAHHDKKCFWPYSNIIIGWDGNISACCMDVNIDYSIGDINSMSIDEIFKSNKLQDLRESITKKSFPCANSVCENCSFY